MVTYFPKYFSDRAILIYSALLLLTPLIFGYPMKFYFWIFGILEVFCFFYFSFVLSKDWQRLNGKAMERKLFSTSAWIRIIYVIVSYIFYTLATGDHFEFGAADVRWYDDMGRLGADIIWGKDIKWSVFFKDIELTDLGYPIFLTIIYALTGKSIILARIVKALLSAWTVVMMYKIARRNFGDNVARMTGVFCMLMPNLVYYCGLHLKETEMLFLLVFFIERADHVFHSRKVHLSDLVLLAILGLSTFFFRGVVCALLFLSFAATLVFSSPRLKKGGKWTLEGLLLIFLGLVIFDNMSTGILGESKYATIQEQQDANMQWRAEREGGNAFAASASSAVYAPLIFTIPFPTLVSIEYQEDQQMIHGGNFVKNITSFFTILALITLLFSGKWRDSVLPIAFTVGYLIVLIFSQYAQSERFHIPSLPFELMFAAYGISILKREHKHWFTIWLAIIFVANIAWSWFKLRGRGM